MKNRCMITVWVVLLFMLTLTLSVSGVGKPDSITSDKAMEISWMMRIKSGEDTTWWLQELEKKFNVKIIPNGIAENDREKVPIMLASGEFPDCGYPYGDVEELYREGVVRGIPQDMIRKHMPNYTRLLDKDYPMGWLMHKNPDNENEYLTLLGINVTGDANLWFVGFRADWAKRVGFDFPDYDKKKIPLDRFGRVYFLDEDVSLDWFEKLLVAFRDNDPDGNGKNDTIPWAGCKYDWWTWAPIIGAFGIDLRDNFLIDGELYEWCITPQYKDFLKLAARWYKMGLVDKEFINLDIRKAWEKVANGLIGATNILIQYVGEDYAMDRPPNVFVNDSELAAGAEVVCIPPPIGPAGKQGARSYSPVGPLGRKFYVNAKVDDEKLIRIMQLLDYARFNGIEPWIYSKYGKPGVHFEWESEPWQSRAILKKAEEVPEGYTKQGNFGCDCPYMLIGEHMRQTFSRDLADFHVNYLFQEKGQKLSIRPYKWDEFNETNLVEVNRKYKDDLKTITSEFYFKAIVGEIDIDSEWDSYVSKWRKNGGDAVLAELKKAPIVDELRKGKIVY